MARNGDFRICGAAVAPGESAVVDLPISDLSNRLPMSLAVKIIHGDKPGPVLFVSAAVHGDEVIGVEIIRRLIQRPALKSLKGVLLLVPVVNGYGFLSHSRYLPDRRDLNRSFPGSASGSLAARLADVFLKEIVGRSDFGIDFHSAAVHRANLPQIRICDGDETLLDLAKAFGAPVILKSALRDGSLRKSAHDAGVPVLLFEGGEGLRFDETVIRAGLAGVLRLMRHVGMVDAPMVEDAETVPLVSSRSYWLRAPQGGLLRLFKALGEPVAEGERIGVVSDLFGETEADIIAAQAGVVIGRTGLPVVNEGDAVAHLARSGMVESAAERVETLVAQLSGADMFYEDEII